MQQQIKLIGKSSQNVFDLPISKDDLELSLLEFLRKANFPIASSCSGEQVCKKCVVSGQVLSCSLSVKSYIERFGQEVFVSYL